LLGLLCCYWAQFFSTAIIGLILLEIDEALAELNAVMDDFFFDILDCCNLLVEKYR